MILGAYLFLFSFAEFQIPLRLMAISFEITRSLAIKTSVVISFLARVRKRCFYRAPKLLQLYIFEVSNSSPFFLLEGFRQLVGNSDKRIGMYCGPVRVMSFN